MILEVFTAAGKQCASPRMKQKNVSDVNGPISPSGGSLALHNACYGVVTKSDRAVTGTFAHVRGIHHQHHSLLDASWNVEIA